MLDDTWTKLAEKANQLEKEIVINDELIDTYLKTHDFLWDDLLNMFYQLPSGLWRYRIIDMARKLYPENANKRFGKKDK